MNVRSWTTSACLAMLAVGCAAFSPAARGEEPAARFLEALRAHGYYDLAGDYLERMEKSPAVTKEFRSTILFEQGLTLIAVSRTENEFAKRQARLDEAQKKFEEFLFVHKNHDLSPRAKTELANVLVERGRVKVAEANRTKDVAAMPALMNEARTFFESALKQYVDSEEEIRKTLDALPKVLDPAKDAKRIAYRDELRGEAVKVQMVQSVIVYELADTALDKKEKDQLLKRAADAYGEVYKKYRRRLAGLYARLQQGRCYEQMGGEKNINEALSYYNELLEQPGDEEPFRVLRTKTLLQAMKCWLSDDLKEKKLDIAITTTEPWVRKMRQAENSDEDWLHLQYELARAYKLKAATLNINAAEKSRFLAEGRKLVEAGARHAPKGLSEKFAALRTELGGKLEPGQKPDPKTFAEALRAGRDGMQTIKEASSQIKALTAKVAEATDKATKQELQQQISDAEKLRAEVRVDSMAHFRKAMSLVEPETTIDDLNFVRYYLAVLYYDDKDYYEAAAIAEFIARNFAGHTAAKTCSTIARHSYLNLYNELLDGARDFETERVIQICDLVCEKWPDEPEAEDARIMLIKFMVLPKQIGSARIVPPENLARAKAYLAKIPPDSKRRGEAELSAGQAMWNSFLKGLQEWRDWDTGIARAPAGMNLAARKAELDSLKTDAQTTLKDGIARMRQAGVDPTLANAVLSLCQIYVDAEQADDAIALLEDQEIGPLTLVANKDAAVQREGFAEEAYKTALRSYIGSLPTATDKAAMIAKAEGVMDALNKRVGEDEAGKQKLVGIYVGLAKDVAKQIESAAPENKKLLTQGFVSFLDKVSEDTTNFGVMSWVAENYLEIGEANRPKTGAMPAEVKAYYDKAASQYGQLVAKAQADTTITSDMLAQLRLRMANVHRRQGRYVAAMDQYEEILKDKRLNTMLNVQIDAANTYMEWAASGGVPKLYLIASKGGRSNRSYRNNVWGWLGIDSRLSKQIDDYPETKDKFVEMLHQAKVKKAECNYLYALTQDDEARRQEFLQRAKDDIRLAYRADPSLGNSITKKAYEDMLRQVQTALKEEPNGLEAFPLDVAAGSRSP